MHALIAVAVAFLLGLLCPAPSVASTQPWLAMVSLALGLLLAAGRTLAVPRWLSTTTAWLIVPASFGTGLAFGSPSHDGLRLPPAGLCRLRVVVEEVSHLDPLPAAPARAAPFRGRSRVRVIEGARLDDGAPVAAGTRLSIMPHALPEGATLLLLARLSPNVPFRNPSPHTPLPSARAVHAHAQLPAADSARVIEHAWPARWLWLSRSWLRQRLTASLTPEVATVARALTLGDPDALAEPEQMQLRASGLAHVFAVSGMHVTLLAGGFVLALGHGLAWLYVLAARIDVRRLAAALGVPGALVIGAFTGAAPSGLRAAVTSAIAFALLAAGLRPQPAAVAALASLLFGAVWPEDALRPAYLLSIAATAAILASRARPATSVRELVVAAARLSLRTSAATAPISLWSFGSLPLIGVLANLLMVPVGSGLLVLSVLHALAASLAGPLTWLTALPLELTSAAFLQGCAFFAALDPQWQIPLLSDAQGITLVALVCALLFTRRARAYVLLVALVALMAEEWQLRRREQPRDLVRATYLDVGQGDASLIDLPDGRCMLIDGGGDPQGVRDPGARAIVPLLSARRRRVIDVVVLSHPHPDHYGGLNALLDAAQIAEVWDSGQARAELAHSSTARAAHAWLERARARGARVREPAELCGRPQVFGGARVEMLWPCPSFDSGHDPNDNSLVLRVSYRARAFLFAGDIEAHAEASLASDARLRADVLKVPHHGSNTSSSADFLRAVSPTIAVISAGAHNRFGHPNPQVLARLSQARARVIQLARVGGTLITTDGKTLTTRSWAD